VHAGERQARDDPSVPVEADSVDPRPPVEHPASDARRLQDVERARVDGQCSGLLAGLVAHLDNSGNLPLPSEEERGPKADRPGPDNYWFIVVAHVVPLCLKARLDRTGPAEQADVQCEETRRASAVPLQSR
jgi:hypothetical protein